MTIECLNRLKKNWINERLQKIREKLKENINDNENNKLIIEIAELQNQLTINIAVD